MWHHGIAMDPGLLGNITQLRDSANRISLWELRSDMPGDPHFSFRRLLPFVHFKKKKSVREKLQIFRLLCSRVTEVFFLRALSILTKLTGQLEGLTLQRLQLNTLRGLYILLRKNARDYHASVPSSCFIFFANWRVAGQFWQKESALRLICIVFQGLFHLRKRHQLCKSLFSYIRYVDLSTFTWSKFHWCSFFIAGSCKLRSS